MLFTLKREISPLAELSKRVLSEETTRILMSRALCAHVCDCGDSLIRPSRSLRARWSDSTDLFTTPQVWGPAVNISGGGLGSGYHYILLEMSVEWINE